MSAVTDRVGRAWEVLGTVLDPEVPALSVCDLGIVRDVIDHGAELEVVLTPTYSGCPATEVIEQNVLRRPAGRKGSAPPGHAAPRAGLDHRLDQRRGPPQAARVRHRAARPGAARRRRRRSASCAASPPSPARAAAACTPSALSAFGSTACKALYRCLDCREPFEYFKPL